MKIWMIVCSFSRNIGLLAFLLIVSLKQVGISVECQQPAHTSRSIVNKFEHVLRRRDPLSEVQVEQV